MEKAKIKILIPLAIIACFVIYTWIDIFFSDDAATWRHYIGLIIFLLLVFLFFKNYVVVTIGVGIFLLLATFNALAITTTISTSWITIFSVPTPPVHLLSLGIFILYLILNMDALIKIYLDYKDGVEKKAKK